MAYRFVIPNKLLAFAAGLLLSVSAQAALFPQFGPATGILKGNASSPQTTAATASDIVALWANSCTSVKYLKANGDCDLISLASSVTGTLPVANGGTNLTVASDDNVMVCNGTTWQSKALTDCDAASSAVTYDTTTNAWGCNTIAGASFANPSASVGLTAVNGAASTAMRSDAAPALDQGITPTWTGLHTHAANIVPSGTRTLGTSSARWSTLFASAMSDGSNLELLDSTSTTARVVRGTSWTALQFGNATSNPTYGFLGTGRLSAGGTIQTTGQFEYASGVTGFMEVVNRSGGALGLKIYHGASGATPTTTFSAAGGLALDGATGGDQGAGTINAKAVYDDGVQITNQAGANPTASVGLTAVNGSAGTFLRSDGAPALSQAIVPTWTGVHTFTPGSAVTSAVVVNQANADNGIAINSGSGASRNARILLTGTNASSSTTQFYIGINPFSTDGSLDIYNASGHGINVGPGSSPTVTLKGSSTYATVASGGSTWGGATGGAQGAGTINATGLYINGVSVEGGVTTTSTFTATLASGFSGSPTCTLKYRKTGSQVSLFVNAGGTCTSTSTANTFTFTGLPAAIQPAVNAAVMGVCTDNGLDVPCAAGFGSSGTVTFYKDGGGTLSSTGWTASGTKGFTTGVFNYDLRN